MVWSYDPLTDATAWADAALHVDGIAEHDEYHDLLDWTAPEGSANHHGRNYFLTNQQRDEHDVACTQCHGADYQGGVVGVSCNNPTCHGGQDWTSCTFCHGTPPSQNQPPFGVGGEVSTGTLAVGRHGPHLASSSTHVAFACGICHTVPAAGDVSHALGYVPSIDPSDPGHHGDLLFSAQATTQGAPVTARGTCVGACHSNGRDGAPNAVPYWAGGSWAVGDCANCHSNPPANGEHGKHRTKATCNECHPPADSSSHLNGSRDTAAPPGMTFIAPGGPCGAAVTCTGSCHDKDHQDECW